MRHRLALNRDRIRFPRHLGLIIRLGGMGGLVLGGITLPVGSVCASLQIAWEAPGAPVPRVLKEYSLAELASKKTLVLTEKDPLESNTSTKFQGVSLARLIEEATQGLTAADRSSSDLIVMKTRSGREVLMPKAFLVKYPEIQIALRQDGKDLGAEGMRVVLPATSSSKIRRENILLEPMFVSELASVTLSSYDKRYGRLLLQRRTDPAAMRGEKLFLQNCVACHTQPQATVASLDTNEKLKVLVEGAHPTFPGNNGGFKAIFDKKAMRSVGSYLDAFRSQGQAAKN